MTHLSDYAIVVSTVKAAKYGKQISIADSDHLENIHVYKTMIYDLWLRTSSRACGKVRDN